MLLMCCNYVLLRLQLCYYCTIRQVSNTDDNAVECESETLFSNTYNFGNFNWCDKTINALAQHLVSADILPQKEYFIPYKNQHLDLHNLYGFMSVAATREALQKVVDDNTRRLIHSGASSAGLGTVGASQILSVSQWLGDFEEWVNQNSPNQTEQNYAKELFKRLDYLVIKALDNSIYGINLFGFETCVREQIYGSDLYPEIVDQFCSRVSQLSSFMPLYQISTSLVNETTAAHNAKMLELSIDMIGERYNYLPTIYNNLYKSAALNRGGKDEYQLDSHLSYLFEGFPELAYEIFRYDLNNQFMLGQGVMVVVPNKYFYESEKQVITAYFPPGIWSYYWTHDEDGNELDDDDLIIVSKYGGLIQIRAETDRLPIFVNIQNYQQYDPQNPTRRTAAQIYHGDYWNSGESKLTSISKNVEEARAENYRIWLNGPKFTNDDPYSDLTFSTDQIYFDDGISKDNFEAGNSILQTFRIVIQKTNETSGLLYLETENLQYNSESRVDKIIPTIGVIDVYGFEGNVVAGSVATLVECDDCGMEIGYEWPIETDRSQFTLNEMSMKLNKKFRIEVGLKFN